MAMLKANRNRSASESHGRAEREANEAEGENQCPSVSASPLQRRAVSGTQFHAAGCD